jgi:rieske iron-sulfur protein
MVEESKEKPSAQQDTKPDEKKPPAAVPAQPKPSAAAVRPPAPPARPPPPPAPASRPPAPKDTGRRKFVKALMVVGAVLSIIPFIPWESFLTSSVEVSSGTKRYLLQQVVIDDLPVFGPARGKAVNVNDLTTFKPNDHWQFTYPTSGSLSLDTQNPDTFLKYELIRLPVELGGDGRQATDFVAFSKVCVHLWCSPSYNPTQVVNPEENGYKAPAPQVSTHEEFECPCHGSIYRIPDGKAVAGPAALQQFPTNAIPMLTLQADSKGNLYVYYPNLDPSKPYPSNGVDSVEADGVVGYGRDYASYESFIKPAAGLAANTADLKQEVS